MTKVSIKTKERLAKVPVFSKILLHSSPWDQFYVTEPSHVGLPQNT